MAIPKPVLDNFRTMLRAAREGNLALMECEEAGTGTTRYVICAVNTLLDGERARHEFVPFGHLADETMGNPYDFYTPPVP